MGAAKRLLCDRQNVKPGAVRFGCYLLAIYLIFVGLLPLLALLRALLSSLCPKHPMVDFFFPESCLVVHATWSVIASEKNKN